MLCSQSGREIQIVVGMVAEGQRSCRLSFCAEQTPRLLTSYLLGQVATRELQNLCQILFHQLYLFGGNGALHMLGSQYRGLAAGCRQNIWGYWDVVCVSMVE